MKCNYENFQSLTKELKSKKNTILITIKNGVTGNEINSMRKSLKTNEDNSDNLMISKRTFLQKEFELNLKPLVKNGEKIGLLISENLGFAIKKVENFTKNDKIKFFSISSTPFFDLKNAYKYSGLERADYIKSVIVILKKNLYAIIKIARLIADLRKNT